MFLLCSYRFQSVDEESSGPDRNLFKCLDSLPDSFLGLVCNLAAITTIRPGTRNGGKIVLYAPHETRSQDRTLMARVDRAASASGRTSSFKIAWYSFNESASSSLAAPASPRPSLVIY